MPAKGRERKRKEKRIGLRQARARWWFQATPGLGPTSATHRTANACNDLWLLQEMPQVKRASRFSGSVGASATLHNSLTLLSETVPARKLPTAASPKLVFERSQAPPLGRRPCPGPRKRGTACWLKRDRNRSFCSCSPQSGSLSPSALLRKGARAS